VNTPLAEVDTPPAAVDTPPAAVDRLLVVVDTPLVAVDRLLVDTEADLFALDTSTDAEAEIRVHNEDWGRKEVADNPDMMEAQKAVGRRRPTWERVAAQDGIRTCSKSLELSQSIAIKFAYKANTRFSMR